MRQKATSLSALPEKKLRFGRDKLEKAGVTPARWLAMLGADDAAMQRLMAAWPEGLDEREISAQEMVFDAKRVGSLLDVETSNAPAPLPARPDERIIYLPPSITGPTALRRTKAPMWDQDWYDGRGYTAKAGYWGVIVPVPTSNNLSHQGQDKQILDELQGYQRTPMLVDTLLLCAKLLASGEDLLNGDWVRCPELASPAYRVALHVGGGRVGVHDVSGGEPYDRVWSSVARWISE